jgi:hypothetical protein
VVLLSDAREASRVNMWLWCWTLLRWRGRGRQDRDDATVSQYFDRTVHVESAQNVEQFTTQRTGVYLEQCLGHAKVYIGKRLAQAILYTVSRPFERRRS